MAHSAQHITLFAIALEAGKPAPEWVHLVPAGTFRGADGRGPFTLTDPVKVIATSLAAVAGSVLPIDYDHAIDLAAPSGGKAPAAAWIEELQSRDDGIWGRVKWTPAGAAAVEAGEYRFLSPALVTPQKGGGPITAVLRAALTNNPNLHGLKALHMNGAEMDETQLAQLREALGLGADADIAAILATIKALKDGATNPMAKVADALGLKADASADAIIVALHAAKTPDPAQYIPAPQVVALNAQVQELMAEKRDREISEAVKAGKLPPALKDWGVNLHKSDPAAFRKYVETVPAIVGSDPAGPPPTAKGAHGLTALEVEICQTMGMAPETFAAAKKKEG